MSTTYKPGVFTEATTVRLSLDEGRASVGMIVGVDHVRESDGQTFYVVDFDPEHETAPTVVAESILVPVCEHFEEHADEWGLACSEPGVPTSYTVTCERDAERVVQIDDQRFGAATANLCVTHAVQWSLDMARDPDVSLVLSSPITREGEAS